MYAVGICCKIRSFLGELFLLLYRLQTASWKNLFLAVTYYISVELRLSADDSLFHSMKL